MKQFSQAFFKYIDEVKRANSLTPLILGGYSTDDGGTGGPPGGFVGLLPQTRVAYDITEAEISGFVAENPYNASGVLISGSLLDNLNHIRFRLGELEAVASEVSQDIFIVDGELSVLDKNSRFYNTTGVTRTINQVFLAVGTPPIGSGIIVDIHKDGTTIFTDQGNRPEIQISGYTGFTTDIDVPSWSDNEYLTVHIDQVGSSTPGNDLTVHVKFTV